VLGLDITPMIDVVFLLIIFFMATARFAQVTRAELDLPQERGEESETSEEAGLVVNVDASGRILVDQREVDLDELAAIVQAEVDEIRGRDPEALKLMIRADRNGDTARLNAIVSRLQRLGIGAARLATEVPR
jgi:biopolymer transport protein ExbD